MGAVVGSLQAGLCLQEWDDLKVQLDLFQMGAWDRRSKVAPVLLEDGAPLAPRAPLEAERQPPQPQAAAPRPGRHGGRMEGGGEGRSN